MADEAGAAAGGFFAICCESSLFAWCNTQTPGSGSTAVCKPCGCCDDSFNSDAWDEAEKKKSEATTTQPQPGPEMLVPATEPAAVPVNEPAADSATDAPMAHSSTATTA
ncbi:hypothetical protein C8J56DRAFT_1043826 [Mycena floridula]|nr:hypothetical protein C8J56DRAFT_1043826 [Mycena floridula]